MIDIGEELDVFASRPAREVLRALENISPRARMEGTLAHAGPDRSHCPRLPDWLMAWSEIAMGLSCRGHHRQAFRWH